MNVRVDNWHRNWRGQQLSDGVVGPAGRSERSSEPEKFTSLHGLTVSLLTESDPSPAR
jgi:hypothetical protein